jgi:quercetin dioxygenase-like cupin family protein
MNKNNPFDITVNTFLDNDGKIKVIASTGFDNLDKKMNNKEYVDLVNAHNYPSEIKVPLDAPFVDERGIIQNIWLGQCGSVTIITSKAGSIRASHWHENDWHSSYIVSGKIKYTESDINGENKKEYEFLAGTSFFSPPNRWHKMEFLEDTVFITMNGIVKNHESYIKTMHKVDL